MTVRELKEIVPLSEVYEIKESSRYIVKIPKCAFQDAQRHVLALESGGIRNCLLVMGDVQFFEIGDSE